jgi:hypothetical protein
VSGDVTVLADRAEYSRAIEAPSMTGTADDS